MGFLSAILEAYTYSDCYVGSGSNYEGVSTGYLNHPYHSTGYDFGPLCVSKESAKSESECREVDGDPMYKECIDILSDAISNSNFVIESFISDTNTCTPMIYHEKYILKENGKPVIEALIKRATGGFYIYDELRTLTYKGQTYRYGYISGSIASDTHDHLVDLFKKFNSDRATLSSKNAQQDFEQAMKEFENLVVEAKKAGTLHVNQEIHHGTPAYDIWNARNLGQCDTAITYTVKINGKYIGMCNEGERPRPGGHPFDRLAQFKGKSYKEEELNFNCFWYSMLIVQMRQWNK